MLFVLCLFAKIILSAYFIYITFSLIHGPATKYGHVHFCSLDLIWINLVDIFFKNHKVCIFANFDHLL